MLSGRTKTVFPTFSTLAQWHPHCDLETSVLSISAEEL